MIRERTSITTNSIAYRITNVNSCSTHFVRNEAIGIESDIGRKKYKIMQLIQNTKKRKSPQGGHAELFRFTTETR